MQSLGESPIVGWAEEPSGAGASPLHGECLEPAQHATTMLEGGWGTHLEAENVRLNR